MMSSIRPFALIARTACGLCVCTLLLEAAPALASTSATPDTTTAASPAIPPPRVTGARVMIPGPLRSFLRMAGISQEVQPDEVLPLVARNSYLLGYGENTQTEFLRLLNRYLHQARELQILAGQDNAIHVTDCNGASTLLRVLGYRLRAGCDPQNMYLETTNATRAFLTIDSGFPLTDLEEALQKGQPFTYPYPTTWVPVMFQESDWLSLGPARKENFGNLVDLMVNDQQISRLYWAISKNDPATAAALDGAPGLRRLLPMAATLDFYGNEIAIRDGRVVTPGGAAAEKAWKDLVGASPAQPSEFVTRLLARDNGWMAAYYDAVAHVPRSQQDHLVTDQRLKQLYDAFRSPDAQAQATRGVFRRAPDLLVLLTRVSWEPDGSIHVPGGLDAWKQILKEKPAAKLGKEWGVHNRTPDSPEELLEDMVGFSRVETDSGPLQIYLAASEIDSERPADRRISGDTVKLMASQYPELSRWYMAFAEFPELSDASIAAFVQAADGLNKVSNQALRGNALGAFQADIGIWQILARQGEIPAEKLDASWQAVIAPYNSVTSENQLFEAARNSLSASMDAATGKHGFSEAELVDLLAGPQQQSPEGAQVHGAVAARMRAVMSDQRMISLDTLFALNDGLAEMAAGKPAPEHLLALAGELRDFEIPRQIFTKSEKVDWAPRANTGHHAELQIKTDLTRVIQPMGSKAQIEAARAQLAPLLRDTLVGLNYAYYEPPGAQILHINPLFVRSHDFLGISVVGSERIWQAPTMIGAGVSAGGGGYLMGSLADLPYALASAEQDMIAPEYVQALIWKELVPQLLSDAVVSRWWNVPQDEMHAVALYQKLGEQLLTACAVNAHTRERVTAILSDRLEPRRLSELTSAMQRPEAMAAMLPRMMPEETFYIGTQFEKLYPADVALAGDTGKQIADLVQHNPADVSLERLSRDFGIPHPTLAQNSARELLNGKPFPFYGVYSSRLFGESWESGNLYWARLADDMGYSPAMLNRLVPELTRQLVSKIFATDLEDWPAVLRAMHETGDQLKKSRAGEATAASSATPAAPMQ
jgi:hypothetical protein